ncbi:MAG: hypothetical protein AB7T06_46315 [Kofleriaceae bacterium]
MRHLVLASLLVPSLASAEPINRIGAEGWLSYGRLVGLAASVHYERGHVGTTTAIVRVEAAGAANLVEGPEPDRQALSLTVGGRLYVSSRGYICGELGPSAVHYPTFDDMISMTPARWDFGYAARLGIGAQFRSLDIGIAGSLAVLGIGFYIGGNIAAWE